MNGHVHGNLHQNKERSLYCDIFKLVKVHTEMCEDFNETEPKTFCEVQVASLDASIISGPSYANTGIPPDEVGIVATFTLMLALSLYENIISDNSLFSVAVQISPPIFTGVLSDIWMLCPPYI